MHRHYFHLTAHDDVNTLELEDGLIRTAVAELITQPSTINEIVVDIPRQRAIELGDAPAAPLVSLVISAEEADDTVPNLQPLVAEVAVINDSWQAQLIQLLPITRSWVGNTTPGVKVSAYVEAAPGIDAAALTAFLKNIGEDAAEIDEVVAGELLSPSDRSARSILSLQVDPEAELDALLSSGAFETLSKSELIETSSLAASAASEHRIVPNPNTWQ